jgi:hypothetical protein
MAAMAAMAASAGAPCTYGLLSKPSGYAEFPLVLLIVWAKTKQNG